MKIKESQLRKIIRESLQEMLNDNNNIDYNELLRNPKEMSNYINNLFMHNNCVNELNELQQVMNNFINNIHGMWFSVCKDDYFTGYGYLDNNGNGYVLWIFDNTGYLENGCYINRDVLFSMMCNGFGMNSIPGCKDTQFKLCRITDSKSQNVIRSFNFDDLKKQMEEFGNRLTVING